MESAVSAGSTVFGDADDSAKRTGCKCRARRPRRQTQRQDRRAPAQKSDRADRRGAQPDRAAAQGAAIRDCPEHSPSAFLRRRRPGSGKTAASAPSYAPRRPMAPAQRERQRRRLPHHEIRTGSRASSRQLRSPPMSAGHGLNDNPSLATIMMPTRRRIRRAGAAGLARRRARVWSDGGTRGDWPLARPVDVPDVNLLGLKRGGDRVSRRHAEIVRAGRMYFIRDLGSLNGTYIAGRGQLGRDQLYKLKDRDEVVLGGAILQFRRGLHMITCPECGQRPRTTPSSAIAAARGCPRRPYPHRSHRRGRRR